MSSRTFKWTLAALTLGTLFLLFVFRSPLETYFAAPEADYTPDAELAPSYPRPGADLTAVWTVPLERGYGAASIDGDEVFVLDREVGVQDTLRVLDLASGELLWSYSYESPGRPCFTFTANLFESPPKTRLRMWAPTARIGGVFVVRGEESLRCVHLSSSGVR